jgi:hypothetical protein
MNTLDHSRVALVICLTVFVVIGFNALIYLSFSKRNPANFADLLQRTAKGAKHPWESEDEALKKLSGEVAKLKSKGAGEPVDETQKEKPE